MPLYYNKLCWCQTWEQKKNQDKTQMFKERLQQNLGTLNMAVRLEVPGDGNCFFHSVVDQMKRLSIPQIPSAIQLRKQVVDYLRNLKLTFPR